LIPVSCSLALFLVHDLNLNHFSFLSTHITNS
jgi:hypothetical protein